MKNFYNKKLNSRKSLLMGGILLVFLIPTSHIFAWVYTNTYPYPTASHCGCQADPWSFYKRQCTSYVAWKINELGYSFSNGMTGPNGSTGWFGNANNWDNNALSIGFVVNSTPVVGSIAVWEANSGGAGGSGHVAFVQNVNSNGTVDISEYNWNGGEGIYNERFGRVADKYVHVGSSSGGSCSGPNPIIQNTTINGPYNCSNVGTITVLPVTTLNPGSGNIVLNSQ